MRNAQDGISLIQTSEGALTEAHAILRRMRKFSVQASNDTNTATDRFELQKEVNQLTEELTRIEQHHGVQHQRSNGLGCLECGGWHY